MKSCLNTIFTFFLTGVIAFLICVVFHVPYHSILFVVIGCYVFWIVLKLSSLLGKK